MNPVITLYESNIAIVQFLTGHAIAIFIVIKVIKWVSKYTPWKWDDDIAPLLSDLMGSVRNNRGAMLLQNEDQSINIEDNSINITETGAESGVKK